MKKAVLTLCVGELYWELARFVPYILFKKKNEPETDFFAITREDRYDLYGNYIKDIIPLNIQGDGIDKKAECFRLNNFSLGEYYKLIEFEKNKLLQKYDEVETIFPKLENSFFAKTLQFPTDKFSYDYMAREKNKLIIEKFCNENKKEIIIIAPRFREGIPRNWSNWKDFYNLVFNSDLNEKFTFILCGKKPDYIEDKRFLDLNTFVCEGTSLIGLTIELIKKSKLLVGTQSALPSFSLLLGTEVLQWGHNRKILTSKEYNPFEIRQTFLDDHKYCQKASIIFDKLKQILNR